MKKYKLDLQMFAGSLTVTVYKDEGITTATASPASSLEEGDTVTLTVTPASGKEIASYDVLSGGVTVDPATKKFDMGESNVVLVVRSKGDNVYKVVENTPVWINGSKTELTRNMQLLKGPNGAIVGVDCTGTAITFDAAVVSELVKAGAIIKI